jgi:malate synthase
VWQWIHHRALLDDGRRVTRELAGQVLSDEMTKLRTKLGDDFAGGRFAEAADLFEQVALSERFVEFLTVPAYDHID